MGGAAVVGGAGVVGAGVDGAGDKFAKMRELFQFHVFQFRWAQGEVGVALGVLKGGVYRKVQPRYETDQLQLCCTSKLGEYQPKCSCSSWAVDPVLHHEATVKLIYFSNLCDLLLSSHYKPKYTMKVIKYFLQIFVI